jgi:ABC-type oligopeptide transport system ATPase subunit
LTAPLLQCAGEISRGKSTTGLAILRMLDITQGRIVCMPVSARAAAAA